MNSFSVQWHVQLFFKEGYNTSQYLIYENFWTKIVNFNLMNNKDKYVKLVLSEMLIYTITKIVVKKNENYNKIKIFVLF